MALSQSDIRRTAEFVRKVTKAPSVEAVVSETLKALKRISGIDRVRIVYSPSPSKWREWKATEDGLEVRSHDEWPRPEKRTVTVPFDAENVQSGFISADKKGEKVRSALEMIAPEVWSALLLQSALARVQKAAVSETELVRATLRARDEERRHIARELHDDLGQSLAALRLTLKWAEDLARPENNMREVVKEMAAARHPAPADLAVPCVAHRGLDDHLGAGAGGVSAHREVVGLVHHERGGVHHARKAAHAW